MGPIGLGAAPSMQAAVMQQQQQQPAVSNYTGMQRGVGGAGGGGGGGGGSGRKPSKAIRIVDPSTMQEVDLSVSGGAGGNPPPRSVSPANIPIRPPPAGGGSQPSTTAADTFRQQVLEKVQTSLIKPAPNAIIRAPKITTKSHEGVEPPTETKFGVPVTISAPPLTGPPLNIPPGVFLPPGTGIVQTQKPSRPHFDSVVPNPHAAAFHPAPPLAATGQLQSQPPKVHELPPVSGAGLLATPNIPPRTAALTHEATNGHAMLPHSLAAPIPSAGATVAAAGGTPAMSSAEKPEREPPAEVTDETPASVTTAATQAENVGQQSLAPVASPVPQKEPTPPPPAKPASEPAKLVVATPDSEAANSIPSSVSALPKATAIKPPLLPTPGSAGAEPPAVFPSATLVTVTQTLGRLQQAPPTATPPAPVKSVVPETGEDAKTEEVDILPPHVAKDAVAKDTVAKDAVAKDTVAKDASAKDTAAKDTVAKDTVAKDAVAKDAVAKDAVAKDTVAKDAVAKETNDTKVAETKETVAETTENVSKVTKTISETTKSVSKVTEAVVEPAKENAGSETTERQTAAEQVPVEEPTSVGESSSRQQDSAAPAKLPPAKSPPSETEVKAELESQEKQEESKVGGEEVKVDVVEEGEGEGEKERERKEGERKEGDDKKKEGEREEGERDMSEGQVCSANWVHDLFSDQKL